MTDDPSRTSEREDGTGGGAGEEGPLRVLSERPPNAGAASRSTYGQWETPTDEFFVRSHYETPDIDAQEWAVTVEGRDGEARDWSMREIREELPTESLHSTMACAGLGRSYFKPEADGKQWRFGSVGNARWTGSPVSALLEARSEAPPREAWLTVTGADAPDGEDVYTRSIPMSKVLDDCLLAYEMNGETLPPDHGYPIRLIVPGWYGCNSVKWVDRMIVTDEMVCGPEWEDGDQPLYTRWQQYSYRLVPYGDEEPNQRRTVALFDLREQMESDDIVHPFMFEQVVHSMIVAPEDGAVVDVSEGGGPAIGGVAWAGENEIEAVEVSADGGSTWTEAELVGPDAGPTAWRQFRCEWSPSSGEYTLVSRAVDAAGRTQPARISSSDRTRMRIEGDVYPANRRGYGNNAYETYRVDVSVRG